ncbi:MAG: acetyl-CoA carboxylase biotin carboxylase subunit, partial [Candidatus Tectomicrobia bacterium]|nr:acetyl-CoA carboxylase biotin carboxylase subunit [Candidatus Tectomicrobia bacterium]
LLKATAGGGGRGMRVVREAQEVPAAFAQASREAQAAFGAPELYLERYLPAVRHVEVQVLADSTTVLHLGERDCSIQRRHQKLLEESPAPGLSSALRARLSEAAVRLCQHVGYTNAGTVEYVLDTQTEAFYFLEMNTRLQVEHPVTEMVTGVDLVKAQIQIAQGQPLAWCQEALTIRGHALECRINAEDPARHFLPCPGRVQHFHAPGGPGIRVDSHLVSGADVPPYYDSLLAKLVAWGHDRAEALARMQRALAEMCITGIQTTLPFHRRLLGDQRFRTHATHTRFVEEGFLEDV